MISSIPQVNGIKDAANSTTTPLGAGAEFAGEWVSNNDAQLAFNVLSDTDGTLFIEFRLMAHRRCKPSLSPIRYLQAIQTLML